MKIGYARVSTADQHLDLQRNALRDAGCDVIYADKASGASPNRTGLARAFKRCGPGDVLVVWKLDRLGRSLFDLVDFVERLARNGAGLKVLIGHGATIDTTRAEGRLIFGIFAALAEFERELIRERTIAGLAAARERGALIGRPRKLTAAQVTQARALIDSKRQTWEETAAQLDVHVSTLRRSLRT